MKRSKKILIVVAGVLIALLITSLAVLHGHLQEVVAREEARYNYQAVSLEGFDRLEVAPGWEVRIRQAREYKVEVAAEAPGVQPQLENRDGTLYLRTDSVTSGSLYARITVPSLRSVTASGARVRIENFKSDTMFVNLENGSSFWSLENTVSQTFFKTSGDCQVQFSDDPDM